MKSYLLIVVYAILGPALGAVIKRNPTMDVWFERFDSESCCDDGHQKRTGLETGVCHTFDKNFTYFSYTPRQHGFGTWHHNDFVDRRCSVAVYEYGGCLGRRFSDGPWPDTRNFCTWSPYFDAKAVGVKCDGTIFPGLHDRKSQAYDCRQYHRNILTQAAPGGSLDFN